MREIYSIFYGSSPVNGTGQQVRIRARRFFGGRNKGEQATRVALALLGAERDFEQIATVGFPNGVVPCCCARAVLLRLDSHQLWMATSAILPRYIV